MSHPVRLIRTQASQLIEHGMLTTTHAKALKVRNYLGRLFAQTNKKGVNTRRLIESSLFGKISIDKMLDLPDHVKIQLYHMGVRVGDKAQISRLVLDIPKKEKPTEEQKNQKKSKKTLTKSTK